MAKNVTLSPSAESYQVPIIGSVVLPESDSSLVQLKATSVINNNANLFYWLAILGIVLLIIDFILPFVSYA